MSSNPDSTANQLHQATRINSLAPWVSVRTEGAGTRYLAQCPTGVKVRSPQCVQEVGLCGLDFGLLKLTCSLPKTPSGKKGCQRRSSVIWRYIQRAKKLLLGHC